MLFYRGEIDDYPPFPENYFNKIVRAIFNDYEQHVRAVRNTAEKLDSFPEHLVLEHLDNTWRDTAKAVFNNWLGKIYQLTDQDRRLPFMKGVDPDNPLGL
jgi:homoserine O-succinyltransferase